MDMNIFDFLNASHTQFHSVNVMKEILLANGFKELEEGSKFELEENGKYFVVRNLTSVLAFKTPNKFSKESHFQIMASHSDSPCFKLKENNESLNAGIKKLTVEPYGGLIHSVWLDKPLSIAGRIVVKKGNIIDSRLVSFDKNLCIIPNAAIHLNRQINDGNKYNPQTQLCPIFAGEEEPNSIKDLLKPFIKEDEELVSYDLYLYNREKASFIGMNDEFIASPKLDDLACAYSSLIGFLQAKSTQNFNIFVCFDNEEVGSMSINGADSDFLEQSLKRMYFAFNKDEEDYLASLASSSLISGDNAHATHPNYPELSEPNAPVLLNKGIVVKHNANMRYCSDALSSSLIKTLCEENNLKYQDYYNRSDIRGGSTLGNISITKVSILSVDIGLAQLAMHSNYETMGSKDYIDLITLSKAYFERNIEVKNSSLSFK